jgi:tRNA A37 N6-isopentenylltransferase MiaA
MSAHILDELKKLQYKRSDSSPFASHVEFLQWSDSVAPRLSFDVNLQKTFKRHVELAKSQHNYNHSNVEQINEASAH